MKNNRLECRAVFQPKSRFPVRLWGGCYLLVSLPNAELPCSLQCKPEYKVPGLYVIDSIVRQSRHQFGTDKDVFGPRFSKNITATFQYLYLCPSEDKVGQARLECCCALMWCCLGACTPVTVIWGFSLTLVVTCWEGLSKAIVKCKFKLKDVFCLTSSVLFCLCRHFSSVCYCAKSFFLLRLLQKNFLWKAVSATTRKCCRRSFGFVGSDCPAQKRFLRKSSCSAQKCFLRKSSCWFLQSFPIPYLSFIGALHCQGWSKASFFLVLLYLLIEQRLRRWCEFLVVQRRWFMWPLSEQFRDSQDQCVLEVANWFPENHLLPFSL